MNIASGLKYTYPPLYRTKEGNSAAERRHRTCRSKGHDWPSGLPGDAFLAQDLPAETCVRCGTTREATRREP